MCCSVGQGFTCRATVTWVPSEPVLITVSDFKNKLYMLLLLVTPTAKIQTSVSNISGASEHLLDWRWPCRHGHTHIRKLTVGSDDTRDREKFILICLNRC